MHGDELRFNAWADSLRERYGNAAVDDLTADIRTALVRMDRRMERDMQEVEAARLLPHGAATVVELQGCCRATAYNRARRGRLSKQMQAG